MEQIQRMQDNLKILRKSLGWTAKELAEKLGVSRTLISTLENNLCKMTQIQYLAIYKVVKDEIEASWDHLELPRFILIYYIDDPTWFSDEEEETEIRKIVNSVIPKSMKDKNTRYLVTRQFNMKMLEHVYDDFYED